MVRRYAHRGYIDEENTVNAIQTLIRNGTGNGTGTGNGNGIDAVEVDVRFNTDRRVVLCHDREMRNDDHVDLLETLCQLEIPFHFMVDIKAFGVDSAKQLARAVVRIVTEYRHHTYELCSFNEYCVQELIDLRLCSRSFVLPYTYQVGVISTGVSVGLFGHLPYLNFMSFHYDIIHEEVIKLIREKYPTLQIYTWVCNDPTIQRYMTDLYKVDGIIVDVFKK